MPDAGPLVWEIYEGLQVENVSHKEEILSNNKLGGKRSVDGAGSVLKKINGEVHPQEVGGMTIYNSSNNVFWIFKKIGGVPHFIVGDVEVMVRDESEEKKFPCDGDFKGKVQGIDKV